MSEEWKAATDVVSLSLRFVHSRYVRFFTVRNGKVRAKTVRTSARHSKNLADIAVRIISKVYVVSLFISTCVKFQNSALNAWSAKKKPLRELAVEFTASYVGTYFIVRAPFVHPS